MGGITRYWNLERTLFLIILVAAGMMWVMSRDYVKEARLFPGIISAAVFVLMLYVAILQTIQYMNGTEHKAYDPRLDEDRDPDARSISWILTAGMGIAFLAAMYAFGVGTGIFFYFAVFANRMGLPLKWSVPGAAIFAVVIWYAFSELLNIPMPAGLILPLF